MSFKWDEPSKSWKPWKRKRIEVEALPKWIFDKLEAIPHTEYPAHFDPYYPASVTMKDGLILPNVVFFGAEIAYRLIFDFDSLQQENRIVKIGEVKDITQSPYQLPPRFSRVLYEKGEKHPDSVDFVLTMKDGCQFNYVIGITCLDFINYPEGYTSTDILDIKWGSVPHIHDLNRVFGAPKHSWCFYQESKKVQMQVYNRPLWINGGTMLPNPSKADNETVYFGVKP